RAARRPRARTPTRRARRRAWRRTRRPRDPPRGTPAHGSPSDMRDPFVNRRELTFTFSLKQECDSTGPPHVAPEPVGEVQEWDGRLWELRAALRAARRAR